MFSSSDEKTGPEMFHFNLTLKKENSMPLYQIPPGDPSIRVTFKGFLIAHIEDGSYSAEMRTLDSGFSPCHQPRVHVYQTDTSSGITTDMTPVELDEDLAVVAHKSSRAIQVFWKDANPYFNPLDSRNHPRDFRWFVNLNKIHGLSGLGSSQISIKPDAPLGPTFRINDGIFLTSDRSDGEARLVRIEEPEMPVEAFGKFAQEVMARIYLRGDETAEFLNGDDSIFTATAHDPFIYDIVYDCKCLTDEYHGDFHLVYTSINLPPGTKQVDLVPDYGPAFDNGASVAKQADPVLLTAISPEVYCGGGSYP